MKIDSDKDRERSEKFGVDGVPCQVVINGDEETVSVIEGYVGEEEMLKTLTNVTKRWGEFSAALKEAKRKPDDAAANAAFAKLCLAMENSNKAWDHFDRAKKALEAKGAPDKKELELLADALANLGRLAIETKEKEAAEGIVESMKKASAKGAPGLQDNIDVIAKLLSIAGNKPSGEEIENLYKEFQDLAAKYPDTDQRDFLLLMLSGVAAELKKFDAAEGYLKELIEKLPDSPLKPHAEQLRAKLSQLRQEGK